MGTQSNAWQDRDSVLAQFGQREAEAKEAYRRYMVEGAALGGGRSWLGDRNRWGMVRGEVAAATEEGEIYGERILGSGAFVEHALKDADARTLRQNAFKKTKRYAERVVAAACKKDGVSRRNCEAEAAGGNCPP